MSTSAIRFAPRTRGQRGIRTGALAYQGILASVLAEKERYEAEQREHQAYLDSLPPIVIANAATYDYMTGNYRRHYTDGVKVVRVTRGHLELRCAY